VDALATLQAEEHTPYDLAFFLHVLTSSRHIRPRQVRAVTALLVL